MKTINEIESWQQLTIDMKGIQGKVKPFNTTNLKGNKKGLFSYPSKALTLEQEATYSEEIFKVLVTLGDEVDINFGDDLGAQQNATQYGIKGIVHWYVCQYLKTETITLDNPNFDVNFLPLKATYNVNGYNLFLGSVFRLLTRHTKYPHYAIIGQVICTYIEWCKARRDSDFNKLDKCAHELFGLGHNMAKAENERKIIAGSSRTSDASQQKTKTSDLKKREALKVYPDVIKEILKYSPNSNLPRALVCKKVAQSIEFNLKLAGSVSPTTVDKTYLKGVNFKSYK